MRIHDVPTDLVPELWTAAGPLLAMALEFHPHLNKDDLLAVILAGHAQLVVAVDGTLVGAAAMQIVTYPEGRVGQVVAMGGVQGFYVKYLEPFTDHLELWCRERQCCKISMLGRRGWHRFVKRRGWGTQDVLMAVKELKPRVPSAPRRADLRH